jgi:hypothetical protein
MEKERRKCNELSEGLGKKATTGVKPIKRMKPYQNLSRDSGISAYEYGPGWIHLKFSHGGTYEYTRTSIGKVHLQKLKRLADSGKGLNTFINTHPSIKEGFSRRIS